MTSSSFNLFYDTNIVFWHALLGQHLPPVAPDSPRVIWCELDAGIRTGLVCPQAVPKAQCQKNYVRVQEKIEEEEVMGYDSSVVPLILLLDGYIQGLECAVYLALPSRKAMLHPVEFTARVPGIRHSVRLRAREPIRFFASRCYVNTNTSATFPVRLSDRRCGANIGLTSVYFANRYPDARIFAIEPESENFRLLRLNSARYKTLSRFGPHCGPRRVLLALRIQKMNNDVSGRSAT